MGCCGSTTAEDAAISRKMHEDDRVSRQIQKLLLLGTGASGKSTIFKNLKQNQGVIIDDEAAKEETANTLRSSMVQFMMRLLLAATEFQEEGLKRYETCVPDTADDAIREPLTRFIEKFCELTVTELKTLRVSPPTDVDITEFEDEFEELGALVETLWSQSWAKQTYKMRGGRFSMPDNMSYFFPRAREIFDLDFSPSMEDVIRTRVRTTGMIDHAYSCDDTMFKIIDVGGQKSERVKWQKHFDDVAALLFCVALNHYNEVLFELETQNAMHEAIDVFTTNVNHEAFLTSQIIIFFNKEDLFLEVIKEFPLGVCFGKGVKGWHGPEFWEGPDYAIPEGSEPPADRPAFEVAYEAAVSFIQEIFVSRNTVAGRRIYRHVTTATNPDNIKHVFFDVQSIVINANLLSGGLLPGPSAGAGY